MLVHKTLNKIIVSVFPDPYQIEARGFLVPGIQSRLRQDEGWAIWRNVTPNSKIHTKENTKVRLIVDYSWSL